MFVRRINKRKGRRLLELTEYARQLYEQGTYSRYWVINKAMQNYGVTYYTALHYAIEVEQRLAAYRNRQITDK